MKKTMFMLAALCGVCAAAEPVTDMLFTDGHDWTLGKVRNQGAVATINKDMLVQQFSNNSCGWSQNYGIYSYGENALAIKDNGDTLNFSYMLETNFADSDEYNAAVTLTLIDTEAKKALIVGMGGNKDGYSQGQGAVSAALTTAKASDASIYTFEGMEDLTSLGVIGKKDIMSVTGSISMVDGKAVATFGGNTIELGDAFTVNKLVVTYDCATLNEKRPAMAFLTTTFTDAVPEPATATLSLLALAGLAARRRRH